MILGKALLLKGLAGVTALGGAVAVGVVGDKKGWWTSKNPQESSAGQEETKESIIKKVGLDCGDDSNIGDSGNACSLKQTTDKGVTIKQGEGSSEFKITELTTGTGQGKIKLYKLSGETTGYKDNFKFVIEGGDITSESSNKLEEFETYQIEESGEELNKKYILTRKNTSGKEIANLLGLPGDCSTGDTISCTDVVINSGNIGTIKFDGVTGSPSISGTAKLTVTKESSNTDDFPYGYKFGFKASSSSESTILTINSKAITLKSNEDTEFNIKKDSTNNTISLTQVWSLENLAKKVNLTCTSDNTCTQISGQTTHVKHDTGLDGKTLTTTGSGKIKVYTIEAAGYNKDFRFVIEGGDITITNGDSNKLEEFETYEIKEENGKWYFYRKDKAEEGIKKALGLDGISNCNFPTSNNAPATCTLDTDKLKKIKFEDKGTEGATVANSDGASPTLKISITSIEEKNQFPFGYKFTLISNKDITLNSESSKSIKANTNTEFKIKATPSTSDGTARTLSLEKAWNAKSLGEKVGLECKEPNDSDKSCTLKDGSINVNNGADNSKITNGKFKNSSDSSTKKLKYEEDQEAYNQGIRFYLEGENDVALTKDATGGSSSKEENICKKGDDSSATYYEIKEDGGTWYLTKKANGG